ncbi:MAG: protease modulator HflC [Alphaproteobacteria bacterium]
MTQKSQTKTYILLGSIFIALVLFFASVFTVHQTEQVLLVQLGNPVRIIQEPGLHIKVPFVQKARHFDRRILDLDPPEQQVILKGEKRLDVDAYVRFKIQDPLEFYRSVGNEIAAKSRLSQIVNSTIRDVMADHELPDVLSEKRTEIMEQILDRVRSTTENFGIEIVDVRIRRADYPKQVSEAIYERMRSIWEREAKRFRSEGEEEARRIRASADKDRTILISEAKKKSQQIRGTGDAKSIKIYAEAFNRDPKFFEFYRSLEAYRNSLKGSDTTFVLSPDSKFFKAFEQGK